MTAHKDLSELKPLCSWKIACKGTSNILGEAAEFWWDLSKTAMQVPNQGLEMIRTNWQDRNCQIGNSIGIPNHTKEQQTLLPCTELLPVLESFP